MSAVPSPLPSEHGRPGLPSFGTLSQAPIAILATPKTGNLWIKYVLANVLRMNAGQFSHGHEIVGYFSNPRAERRIVFHAHVPYTSVLQDTLAGNHIKTVSLLRHPLDIFLSLRSHVKRLGPDSAEQAQILSDDPQALRDFAQTYFLGDLAISAMWTRRDAVLLRYENLLLNPLDGFSRLGRELGVPEEYIDSFADLCARMSDIGEIRSHALPRDRGHFTSAEIDKWRRPENRKIVSALLQSTAVHSALRLWGYG
jgi:hypothetical protein